MTGDGGLVEVQATAERTPLAARHLDELLALAARGHRGAARGAGRRRSRGPAELRRGSCSRPATRTSCASSRALLRRHEVEPLPDDGRAAARDRRRRSPRTRWSRRARPRAAHRRARDRRRLGHRGRGAGRRARRALGALRRRATPPTQENLAKLLAEAPGRQPRCATSARSPTSTRRRRRAASSRAAARARSRRSRAASGGFGYDPAFVPDDVDDEPHDGRAVAGREGRDQPPRPRRAGRCSHGCQTRRLSASGSQEPRAAALSIASNSGADPAQGRGRGVTGSVAILTEAVHSSIDLIASIVAFFSVRKADEPADADHPTATRRSRTSPRRSRAMLILVGSGVIVFEAIRRLVDGPRSSTLGFGIAVVGARRSSSTSSSRRYLYRRARETDSAALAGDAAHLRTDACTSFGVLVGLALVQITGADWLDPVVALVRRRGDRRRRRADRQPLLARAGRRGAARDELDAIRAAIRALRRRRASRASTSCARAAPARAATSTCTSSSARAPRSRRRTRPRTSCRTRSATRLRGADVLIHLEPEDRVRPATEITASRLSAVRRRKRAHARSEAVDSRDRAPG